MEKRTLGKTGEQASLLGFGCMRLPLNGPDASCIDQDLATAMIRKAIDQGVNYVDTAWPYHGNKGRFEPGASEPATGRALRDGYREKVKLATKLPTWVVKNQTEMHRTLDDQLRRLETDHIDFYLAHNLNSTSWPVMRQAGMLDFLEEARKDGRIKHIGFSFHDRFDVFNDIVESFDWEFTQIQYNYLDQNYQAGRSGLQLATKKGLGLIVMEPLRGGFLINSIPQTMRDVLAKARPEWSLADWGLRWLWNQPEVHVVLSGMSTMPQVEENLKIAADAGANRLTETDLAALAEVQEYFARRLKVNCTACGYCLPCPAQVNIPKNFTLYNDYWMIDDEAARARAKFLYGVQLADFEKASNCIHCGECEPKCPQGISISAEMEEVDAIFCK